MVSVHMKAELFIVLFFILLAAGCFGLAGVAMDGLHYHQQRQMGEL